MKNSIRHGMLLMIVACLLLGTMCCRFSKKQETASKPNIIYIFVDQLSANMMSCAGNKWLRTPAMDYIAENGIRFTRAYTTNPVCSPARVSLMTGRFPGYFRDQNGNEVRENRGSMKIPSVSQEVLKNTIPWYLQKADYELFYGGKEHLPASLTPLSLGFTDFSDDEREELATEAVKIIKSHHEKPYFMVVSLINPHDICYMAIREMPTSAFDAQILRNGKLELSVLDEAMKIPEGVSKEQFFKSHCPPASE